MKVRIVTEYQTPFLVHLYTEIDGVREQEFVVLEHKKGQVVTDAMVKTTRKELKGFVKNKQKGKQ